MTDKEANDKIVAALTKLSPTWLEDFAGHLGYEYAMSKRGETPDIMIVVAFVMQAAENAGLLLQTN